MDDLLRSRGTSRKSVEPVARGTFFKSSLFAAIGAAGTTASLGLFFCKKRLDFRPKRADLDGND
jgi:hypothetical protein